MENLFQWRDFTGHSGDLLHFKIDCDALDHNDWFAVAELIRERVGPYSDVEGVPRGGLYVAELLKRWVSGPSNPLLIVDDVWTTGGSMEEHRAGRDAIGAVLFARNSWAPWVTPVFVLTSPGIGQI